MEKGAGGYRGGRDRGGMTILRPFGFAAGVLRRFAKTGTASAKPLSKLRIETCVDASKVAKRFEVNQRRLNLSFITIPKLLETSPLLARQWKAYAKRREIGKE